MRSIPVWIGTALLIISPGRAETLISAEDYALGSDVVLESAEKEVKSIPTDTVNVIGVSANYVVDETATATKGVASIFKGVSAHTQAQKDAMRAVDKAWTTSNEILFRSYTVSDEMSELLVTAGSSVAGPSVDVSGFFERVRFSGDTSAYYMPKLKRLLVRHTMPNILAIENVLADYRSAQRDLMGKQVEIETKFVEVSQRTLNELGFSWRFDNKDGGDLELFEDLFLPQGSDLLADGLRSSAMTLAGGTDPGLLSVAKTAGSLQWSLLINALEQADDSDVLSSPRVVTRDGNTASIQIGEEWMIPQSFEIENQESSPFVEYSGWELQLMGVSMEVKPELREEGLIDLELNPKVVDIIGYDDWQAVPKYSALLQTDIGFYYDTSGDDGWNVFGYLQNNVVETLESAKALLPTEYFSEVNDLRRYEFSELNASLPYLRVRELKTKVTVADGSTVGMGGLIYDKLETFRDKVPVLGSIPFLGRLFRSEGEHSVKRNLMIFVTATQVDLDGRRAADLALQK